LIVKFQSEFLGAKKIQAILPLDKHDQRIVCNFAAMLVIKQQIFSRPGIAIASWWARGNTAALARVARSSHLKQIPPARMQRA
jgi:hypothetical protein